MSMMNTGDILETIEMFTPTATPCFRHWRRSSLLLLPRGGFGIS